MYQLLPGAFLFLLNDTSNNNNSAHNLMWCTISLLNLRPFQTISRQSNIATDGTIHKQVGSLLYNTRVTEFSLICHYNHQYCLNSASVIIWLPHRNKLQCCKKRYFDAKQYPNSCLSDMVILNDWLCTDINKNVCKQCLRANYCW